MSRWKRFADELPEVGRYILRAYKDERGRVTCYTDRVTGNERYEAIHEQEVTRPVKYYWQYIEELEEL
jgi:hypothetical protein